MSIIKPVYADVTPVPIGDICGSGKGGLGPFADFLCKLSTNPGDQKNNAIKTVAAFAFFISNVIGFLAVVAGILFIFQFMIAGLNWITAGGDKAKLEQTQQKLLNSIIGLVIVLAAYAIVSLIGKVLGFDILITDPGKFVDQLGIK